MYTVIQVLSPHVNSMQILNAGHFLPHLRDQIKSLRVLEKAAQFDQISATKFYNILINSKFQNDV